MKKVRTQIVLHSIALVIVFGSGILDLDHRPLISQIDFAISAWFIIMLALYFFWPKFGIMQNLKKIITLETISIAAFFIYMMQIRGYKSYSSFELIMCAFAVIYIGYKRYNNIIRKESADVNVVSKNS